MIHGTYSSYTGGCRCDDCRAASAAHKRGLRAGRRISEEDLSRAYTSDRLRRLFALTVQVGDWVTDAACRGMDPDLFFPDRGEVDSAAKARAVCESCPVIDACRSYAVAANERDGIWGGLSEKQRRRLRRAA